MSKSPNSPTNLPGVQAWIWPLVLIGFGAYRINHATYSQVAHAGNVLMILFGLIGLLMALVTSMSATPRAGGEKIATQQKALYGGLHDFRDATDEDFRPLDRAFYETASAELAANGFRHVRDLVDVTTSNSWPRNHTVIRCFLGNSNSTVGAVYHLRMYGSIRIFHFLGLIPGKLKIVEFESELSDGTFVSTSNTIESERTLGYPFVDRLQFPSDTPHDQLIQSHRSHLNSVLAGKPGVHAVAIHTYRELRASQDRLQLLKNAHRTSPNFDYGAELAKIAGRSLRPYEEDMADQVSQTMQSSGSPSTAPESRLTE